MSDALKSKEDSGPAIIVSYGTNIAVILPLLRCDKYIFSLLWTVPIRQHFSASLINFINEHTIIAPCAGLHHALRYVIIAAALTRHWNLADSDLMRIFISSLSLRWQLIRGTTWVRLARVFPRFIWAPAYLYAKIKARIYRIAPIRSNDYHLNGRFASARCARLFILSPEILSAHSFRYARCRY